MHIYHYAAYELSAVRRLSIRHDTRQDKVDEMLRAEVFIDLYQIVRNGLRISEDSYSIKKVERLYRSKRVTEVANAVDSIVQYARWIEFGEARDWKLSPILKGIRDYNKDDCISTAELAEWMRTLALEHGIASAQGASAPEALVTAQLTPEALARIETARQLREKGDPVAIILADLMEFHRRESKPVWWRMFDRAEATAEELRDDPGRQRLGPVPRAPEVPLLQRGQDRRRPAGGHGAAPGHGCCRAAAAGGCEHGVRPAHAGH